jgi:L-asparagine transporter-like permease
MTPENLHDMFFASAGVAGALIGLLFVAISIEHDRLTAEDADQVQRVRTRAALGAFTNALTVSLFALIPGHGLTYSSISVGAGGILFVLASVLSVRRMARSHRAQTGRIRNLTFLIAQLIALGFQVYWGIALAFHPHSTDDADNIAILVIVCFLIGIYRAWELIGGPDVGFGHELRALVRERKGDAPEESDS